MLSSKSVARFNVVIALGSNLGDRLGNLRAAKRELALCLDDLRASPVYETAPMYVADQPAFLNAALIGATALGPLALLRRLKSVEDGVGRQPRERNGPREIDLDLILYGAVTLRSRGGEFGLSIPHPRLGERRFVLQPVADLLPDLVIPAAGPVSAMLAATDGQVNSVRRYGDGVL